MLVAKNKVVSFYYILKDDSGNILDQTEPNMPFSYLHGIGQIIPGLEKEMEGKDVNSKFSVHVDAKDAYGEHDDSLILKVDRSFFGSEPLQKGLQLQLQSQDGYRIVTIMDFNDKEVTLDANHPLAGVNLNFDIEIKDVRDATEDELIHGHAHSDVEDDQDIIDEDYEVDIDLNDSDETEEDDQK